MLVCDFLQYLCINFADSCGKISSKIFIYFHIFFFGCLFKICNKCQDVDSFSWFDYADMFGLFSIIVLLVFLRSPLVFSFHSILIFDICLFRFTFRLASPGWLFLPGEVSCQKILLIIFLTYSHCLPRNTHVFSLVRTITKITIP
jgi:hypothetical protein